MYASNYLEEKVLNLMRGSSGESLIAPASLQLALFYSNPQESGGEGTEASYQGYVRQPITFGAPQVSASDATILTMSNDTVISFPEAAAAGQSVAYVAVFDNQNNMLLYSVLNPALTIQAGVTPVFRAGSLKWTWSGNLSTYYRTLIMNTIRGANASISAFNPWIGLYIGNPFSGGLEVSRSDYQRFAVTMGAPVQNETSGVARSVNIGDSDNVSVAAESNWGIITYFAMMDAQTNGNIFAAASLGTSYNMLAGSVAGFHPGDLEVTIN